MTKNQKTSVKEIKKTEAKEIKKDLEIQELAMQVKNDIPPLEAEGSLEEKVMKKQLGQLGKVYEDDDEEDELNPIKNLEEELEDPEDILKDDKDKEEDLPYTTYGEMNRDYEKIEAIKGYMIDPNKELPENQIIKNQQKAIDREIQRMSEEMKMIHKSSKPGEEYLPKQKDKFGQFKNMSEDYK